MTGLMNFLRNKHNRDVLGWLGGGVVVLAGAGWAVFTYVRPSGSGTGDQANSSANVREIRSQEGSQQSTATPVSPTQPGPEHKSRPPVSQNIVASEGSVVIGGDASNVFIDRGN